MVSFPRILLMHGSYRDCIPSLLEQLLFVMYARCIVVRQIWAGLRDIYLVWSSYRATSEKLKIQGVFHLHALFRGIISSHSSLRWKNSAEESCITRRSRSGIVCLNKTTTLSLPLMRTLRLSLLLFLYWQRLPFLGMLATDAFHSRSFLSDPYDVQIISIHLRANFLLSSAAQVPLWILRS